MKKILLTLFTFVLALNAVAQARATSGTWGDNIQWSIEGNTLYLYGEGEMKDAKKTDDVPWLKFNFSAGNYQDMLSPAFFTQTVVIANGITSVGSYCFASMGNLTTVVLPSSINKISSNAFINSSKLSTLSGDCILSEISLDATSFAATGLIRNNGALYIGKKLICVFSDKDTNNIEIEDETTEICKNAFEGNIYVTSITVPSTITKIGDNAFSGCSSLSDFTLNADNVTFGSNVFAGCSGLPSDGTYRKAGEKVIVKVEDKSKVKYTISGDIKFIAEDAFDDTNPKFIEFEGPTAPQIKTSSLPTDYTTIVEKEHASNFKGFKNVNTTKIDLTKDKLTTCTFLHDAVIPDGIAVYRAKVDDGGDVINLYKLNSDNKSISIKKGQGVILKAYSGAQYTFNMANTASDIKGDNDIKGCLDDTYLYGSENAFGIKTIDNKQHFIRINSKTTIPAGKAYIQGSSNTASQVRFQYDNLEEEGAMWETSIEDINAESNSNSRIYNMSGQRLSSAQKGLNIIDGKIVMK